MSQFIKPLLILAYLLHIGWVLLLSSVPPVSRDGLTHHLSVPKLWIEHGGIYEIPDISFSYFPQLIDLLYTIPLMLGNDIAAKYIHFIFGLLTALIVFIFIRRRIGSVWGALGGLMFLTIPLILKLSVTVYVDLGLVFFATASLFSALIWLEDTRKWHWLLLAGICSGLALSTKYNAIVSFLVLGLLLPLFFLNSRQNKHAEHWNTIKYSLVFAALALLVFSPWLVRNYNLTGNPIYPLHQSLFSQDSPMEKHTAVPSAQVSEKKPKSLGLLLTRKLVYEESLPYTLLIPLRIFYEGKDDDPKFFDGSLNPLLLLLPLLLLTGRRQEQLLRRENRFLAAYATLIVLYTFFTTDMRVRYVVTIVPPLIVLSVYGLYALHQRLAQKKLQAHMVFIALLSVFFLPNILYAINLYKKIEPLPYLSGKISRDAYIAEHIAEYPLVMLANQLVDKNHRLLGLYLGNRRYYFDIDVTLNSQLLGKFAKKADSPAMLSDKLLQLKISHILLRYDLFNDELSRMPPETRQTIHAFYSNHLSKLSTVGNYGLYKIKRLNPAASM